MTRVVYSTDGSPTCTHCRRPARACVCDRKQATARPGDGIVRVARSTQGRKGKDVTLVTGVPLAGAALAALARELKTACGAGGTVKDGAIELQGEHRDRLIPLLEARGWKVKRSGG